MATISNFCLGWSVGRLLGRVPHEEPDHVARTRALRDGHGSLARRSLGERVGAGREQRGRTSREVVARHPVQGREAVGVPGLDLAAPLNEEAGAVLVPLGPAREASVKED